MALYGRLFSLVRPSQFYVQIFETRLRRITEIPLKYVIGTEQAISFFSGKPQSEYTGHVKL